MPILCAPSQRCVFCFATHANRAPHSRGRRRILNEEELLLAASSRLAARVEPLSQLASAAYDGQKQAHLKITANRETAASEESEEKTQPNAAGCP